VHPEHVRRITPSTRSALRPGEDFEAAGRRFSVKLDPSRFVNNEAYTVEVTSAGITLTAGETLGLLHAGRTLRQLLLACAEDADENGRLPLPTLVIEDWPDFPNRGVMLDVSRTRVPRLTNLQQLVDRLAALKFNQLQLYTEHTFAYPGHEQVWQNASPFAADEIRALDDYCADRGIELVPNQNSFGHMERWLHHRSYQHLAETTEPWTTPWGEVRDWPSVLCPLEPACEPFIAELYDALLPQFTSAKFNIGGDEPWELGQGRSQQACAEHGVGQVYWSFLQRLLQLAQSRGKQVMFFGDIVLKHPELIPELPTDAVALHWGYEANHPFDEQCPRFREAGVPFYVCPSTTTFRSIGGRSTVTPLNVDQAATHGLANNAKGLLITIWGDSGHWQPEGAESLGLTYASGVAWCHEGNRSRDPAKLASDFWFFDPTGEVGLAWHELGQVPEAFAGWPNLLLWVLVMTEAPLKAGRLDVSWLHVDAVDRDQLQAGRATLDQAQQHMASAVLQDGQAQQTRAEFDIAVRLMRHAINNLEARLDEKVGHDRELAAPSRQRLAKELSVLIDDFQDAWLARSRPGGLAESIAPLQRRLANYQGHLT
jgi:hypothetical protein